MGIAAWEIQSEKAAHPCGFLACLPIFSAKSSLDNATISEFAQKVPIILTDCLHLSTKVTCIWNLPWNLLETKPGLGRKPASNSRSKAVANAADENKINKIFEAFVFSQGAKYYFVLSLKKCYITAPCPSFHSVYFCSVQAARISDKSVTNTAPAKISCWHGNNDKWYGLLVFRMCQTAGGGGK